ncbi:MAG: ferrochelatase, partial [Lutibacter sp.]|nr:ferrochelatase [Lutibacter sp.]
LLIPLYPQFAMATTETILALAEALVKKHFPQLSLSNIPAFYHQTDYIEVLSNSVREALEKNPADHILFSYHGVPERHIKKSDITHSHCQLNATCCQSHSKAHEFCYRHQCYETTKRVAKKLGLKDGYYSSAFQSRLGRDPWLQPYTDQTIEDFARNGVKKLAVVTPAFVADCLETLEEIGMEARESFLENGGQEFANIPCLNDREDWAQILANWINDWAN